MDKLKDILKANHSYEFFIPELILPIEARSINRVYYVLKPIQRHVYQELEFVWKLI